jgi:ribosomal protein L37AE/L43A
MKMANCPQCGKPLTKDSGKNQYCCNNEHCPVVFVRSATNPFKRKVVFDSSVREATIRRIEEATAQEISLTRQIRLSCV